MRIGNTDRNSERVFENRKLDSKASKKSSMLIFGIIVCCMAIAVFVCLALFSSYIKREMDDSVRMGLLESTSQKRDKMDLTFNGSISSLNSIATLRSELHEMSDEDFIEIVFDREAHQKYSRAAIVNSDGMASFNDGTSSSISISEAIEKSFSNKSGIALAPSVKEMESVVLCTVPIVRNRIVEQVLMAEISRDSLQDRFDVMWENKASHTYIITGRGEVIMRPVNARSDADVSNIFDVIQDSKTDISSIKADMASGKSGIGIVGFEKSKLYVAYTPLKAIDGWYAVSFADEKTAMKRTNEIIANMLFLALLIMFVASAATLYIHFIKRFAGREIETLSNIDPVTGCSSWRKFCMDYDGIKSITDRKYACVCMNIKNFKFVNDTLGYDVGNQILQHTTDVLSSKLASNEIFTRFNSDRYYMVLEYINDDQLLERLTSIENEVEIFTKANQLKMGIHLCFGIYKILDDDLTILALSDKALIAMQDIKDSTETNFGFFNKTAILKVIKEKELENDMQGALDRKEFQVCLQPKFDLNTGHIIGAEALVRWNHPQKGKLMPGEFIDLFEANGFIINLDFYMFEEACKLIRGWIDSGKEPVPLSVNISRVHLYNPNVAEELYSLTLKHHVEPHLIEIELTESMNFENISMLLGIVSRLKYFDFTVSIDDFGTGYSSLHILKDLPVDIIKIDKDFLNIESTDERGRHIIASIIDMAKRLEMKTVAEGVEKKDQADFLVSVDCDYVQGFYFSKPVPVDEFQTKYIGL